MANEIAQASVLGPDSRGTLIDIKLPDGVRVGDKGEIQSGSKTYEVQVVRLREPSFRAGFCYDFTPLAPLVEDDYNT